MRTTQSHSYAFLAAPFLAACLFLPACGGNQPAPATPAPPATPTSATTAPAGTAAMGPSTGATASKKATKKQDPGWIACHAGFKPSTNDAVTEVGNMSLGCAAPTKMKAVGAPFKGTQSAANPPQTFKFKAQGGHCYRAYAVGTGTVQDLDLLMKDSDGVVAGEDVTDDPTPVVLEDGAICFKADDDASVVVSVGAGQGDFAVQIVGD